MSVETLGASRPPRVLPPETAVQAAAPAPVSGLTPETLDETGRLRPARGIAHGLMISLPVWILIATALWLIF